MSRRLLIQLFLAFLLASVSFGATVPLPPRQKPQQTAPAADAGKAQPAAATILSIIPAQGEPGMTVTLYGAGFTDKSTVYLASTAVPVKLVGPQQLTFDVPKLDPGLYALFLKREDGTTSKTYNFTVLPVRPVISALSPDTVYACSTGKDRDVTVTGHNFREGSQVVFDGAAVRGRFSSSEAISFSAPAVAGGLHQVQVKNPEDTVSGVLGLMIDGRPEISGVTSAEEYVNYYNLVIEGRNFQQNSSLVVMEERSLEETPSRLAVDVKRISSGNTANTTEREQFLFINCNRVIYQRHPYSTVPKNFKVQVINPDGGESSLVSVNAP